MPPTGKSTVPPDEWVVLRYAGAAMAALAALGLRMALDPILGTQAPYVPFIIAIVLASRYGGRGPGLAATAISGLAVDWFYLQPRDSLAIVDPNAAAGLALFVLTGAIVSFFVGRLRESLLSAARVESAPRQTEERMDLPPSLAMAGRGGDRKVKPHYLWLGAAVLLVVIEALLFWGTWTQFAERESRSIRAREVLARIESLLSELKDAETGQRGYLLTGQDSYLAPYNAAVQAIPGQLEDLHKLTLDPGQQVRLVSLQPLIAAKLAELKETIDLRRTGAAAAAFQVLSSDRGKQTMDQIRDVIAAMRAAEVSLLEERSQRAADAAKGMGFVMASGAGLLLILLLAGSRNIDRNLARRQQAQEKMRASEEKFARAFATNPAALTITRLDDGFTIEVNETWQAIMGHSRDEAIGRSTFDLHTWPTPEARTRYAKELREKGSISGQEVTLLRRSGEPFTALLSAVILPIAGEEVALSSWLDISDRKQAEEALERTRSVLAEGQEIAHAGTFEYGVQTQTTVWSEEEYRIYGLDPAGPSPAYDVMLAKCFPADDAARLDRTFRAAMVSGSIYELEHRILRPDGSVRWVHDRAHPHFDRNGKLVRYVGATLDITDRKQAEETLRESEERFRTTMDHMMEGCQIIGNDWKYIYINDAAERHNRRPKGELLGRRYMDMWPGIESTQVFGMIERSMEDRAPRAMENEFTFPDGATAWFDLRVEPMPDGVFIMSVDISERKRAEEARRQTEVRFSNLFESMDEGFAECEMIYDAAGRPIDFRYLAANPAHGKSTGLPTGGMVGRTIREVIPGIEPFWIETYGRIVRTGESERIANPVAGLGKHMEVFAWRSGPGRFAAVSSDVTERKRAEEALLRMSAMVESSDDAIIGKTLEGVITSWNLGAARMYGYSAPEIIGRHISALVPEGHPDEIAGILRRLANGERVEQIEAVRRRKDGSLVDVSLKISPIVDASGKVVGASTIARDITERKRAEEVRAQTNAQLEGILGSIPEPVMVIDEDGHLVKSNNVFERRHLVTDPGTLAEYYPVIDAFTEDGHLVPPEMWPLNRAIKGERTSGLTLRLTFSNGGPPRFYRYSANPIYDRNGRVTHAVVVFFDVTENRLAEEEIRRLNADLEDRVRRRTEQLEAANKELEAFAYSVSHDLRTPLRGIDGWSLALAEDYASQLDERARGYVDRLRAETQRMGMLIDDLLQLSRVTRSEMATGAVDLTSIAQKIAARLTDGNTGRRIEFTIAGGLAANGDARLLEIALENLFGNAVKFTEPRAEARIEFGREGDGVRPFFVRDNGVGFDMAFAGTLFGAFQRLHKTSEFPGTGIGLATVQRIIHRHGGRVWAEAQPDRGATFYFTLGGS